MRLPTPTLHVVWSTGSTISVEEMREAILPAKGISGDTILNRPLGKELDLQGLLSVVARHYLQRALDEAQGNKTEAAKLIGLPSYQTFTNWLKKYEVPS